MKDFHLQPETQWNLDMQFTVDALQHALHHDSQAKTHPMTNDVGSPAEILAMFGPITYEKGASILRMTENIIGSENFKNSTKQFISDK